MASLGSLVTGVAHEVNTPLGIGVTAVSLIQDKTKELMTKVNDNVMTKSILNDYLLTTQKSSNLIFNNLDRASHIINRFKEVAVEQSE